jgi:hypothetical protein
MCQSTVSYLWREPRATQGFSHAVSLHSHTNQSRETLDFIAELATDFPILQPVIRWAEARCFQYSGIRPDYTQSFWTPPLNPRLAFQLERTQIEDTLQLAAHVSLSDHDNIHAPLLLRAVPSAPDVPISVEWTVPYAAPGQATALLPLRPTAFHLGIHNLPGASASDWIARLNAFTDLPVATRPATLLTDILADLHAIPTVLIVFNHPLWDLYRIGAGRHQFLVNDFLACNGQFIHALELNGLRNWDENRAVRTLAAQWNQLVVSGGDRHGIEPNANLNLTHAATFPEFVLQLRRDASSHVLYMPQYRQPWKHRILQSTLDAIRNHPHLPEGSRRWDERVFHPNALGELRPLSELWIAGRSPFWIAGLLASVRLMGHAPVSGGLRIAWNDNAAMHAALTQPEA